MADTVLRVNTEELDLAQFLALGKLTGKLDTVIESLASALIIKEKATALGLAATDAELQQEADSYRKQQGLHRADDTKSWLKKNQLTVEDLESYCESKVLGRKLQKHLFADEVEEYFALNSMEFDRAEISQLVVEEAPQAQELLLQLQEGEASFAELAREYSLDAMQGKQGGYLGWIDRAVLGPTFEAAIFSTKAGECAGPVETDEGYYLVYVHDVHRAELDEETRVVVENRMMQEWLTEQLANAEVEMERG